MLIALNNKIFKQQERQISIKIHRLKTFVVKCKVAYTTEPKSQYCLMLNWQGIPYKSQTTYYNLIADLLNQISETTDITSNSIVITLTKHCE